MMNDDHAHGDTHVAVLPDPPGDGTACELCALHGIATPATVTTWQEEWAGSTYCGPVALCRECLAAADDEHTTPIGEDMTNDNPQNRERDTSDDWWQAILERAVRAVHSGDRSQLRDMPTDDLRVAIEAADDGGATEDVCEALSTELDRRAIAEVTT